MLRTCPIHPTWRRHPLPRVHPQPATNPTPLLDCSHQPISSLDPLNPATTWSSCGPHLCYPQPPRALMREHASKALKRESPDPTRPRAAPLIPESEELLTPVSSRTCAHERAIPEHFHEPGASVGPCRQPGMAMASHRNRSMPMLALKPRITPVLFHALPAPCASIGAANSGGPDARAVAPASARPATKASKAPVDRALHMLREEQGADRFAHQHGAAMWATSSASPSPTSLLGPRVPKVFEV